MFTSPTSTALIPYAPPLTPMELKSEVERGLSNGSISIEQTIPRSIPSLFPSIGFDLINSILSSIGRCFERKSSNQEVSLSSRRFEMSNGRGAMLMDFDFPSFLRGSMQSGSNSHLLPISSDLRSSRMSEDILSPRGLSRVSASKKLNGDEIAETLQAEASFTVATDKKPVVATYGCEPCVALGGYDPTNKIAFIVHFSNASEVRKSGKLIFYNIAKLVKEKITTPIQLHLRGGIKGQSEPIIEAIKMWMKQRDDLPMEIASEDILDSGLCGGKSLSIDSRTGSVSEYDPMQNPKFRKMSDLDAMSTMTSVFDPQIKLAYTPK